MPIVFWNRKMCVKLRKRVAIAIIYWFFPVSCLVFVPSTSHSNRKSLDPLSSTPLGRLTHEVVDVRYLATHPTTKIWSHTIDRFVSGCPPSVNTYSKNIFKKKRTDEIFLCKHPQTSYLISSTSRNLSLVFAWLPYKIESFSLDQMYISAYLFYYRPCSFFFFFFFKESSMADFESKYLMWYIFFSRKPLLKEWLCECNIKKCLWNEKHISPGDFHIFQWTIWTILAISFSLEQKQSIRTASVVIDWLMFPGEARRQVSPKLHAQL